MSKRRVVVTGLGCVSPLGNDVEQTWSNILARRSGAAPITRFDPSALPVRFACTVKDFDPEPFLPRKDQKKMDLFIQYGYAAGIQAWEDAGLDIERLDPLRVGAAIGSGIGGLRYIEEIHKLFLEGGARKVTPFFVPASIINMIAGNLSIRFGFQGPNIAIVTACTTGTHNIGEAARLIQYGDADVMLAGGAEMATSPLSVAGFAAARALSTRNDDPATASRPFDVDRDGFVLGEGAAVLVLEEYEHAKRRGARIYAELAGYGMSGDAHHITQPRDDGAGAVACMRNALRDAGLPEDAVDYINAHGTSTPAGDVAEIRAIKRCFGGHAEKLMVSSTKSMTGHMLGAAGAIEALFCILALRDRVVPPTINVFEQDPECDLDVVADGPREADLRVALSNSFGFGGTNGSLIFTRPA
ncbi:MAG: 3-oxoacyl-[acyl-carrier-protein] synthase 2 [Gammaproteobacteria bacterium]|nr:MAG: 3-oxoacyl-[acyl-carrier-protein] synthase 2 [Gammaproteobacteria bacterium]